MTGANRKIPAADVPSSINKTRRSAYNNLVEEIVVSDGVEKSSYITYLYNAMMGEILRTGGSGELLFSRDRAAMRIRLGKDTAMPPPGNIRTLPPACPSIAGDVPSDNKFPCPADWYSQT